MNAKGMEEVRTVGKLAKVLGWAAAVVLAFGVFEVASAQPAAEIDAGLYNEQIQVFFVGDLGLTSNPDAPPIFWVDLRNADVDTHQVTVRLQILKGDGTVLAEGTSRPFGLEPGVRRITNRNLLSLRGELRLEGYRITDAANEIIQKVMRTGKLPAGVYIFSFDLTDLTAGGESNKQIRVVIRNPSTLDLLAPGAPASSTEIPEIQTKYPLFRWESDANLFRLIVAERSGAPGETPEAAIANNVRLQKTIYVRRRGEPQPTDLPPGTEIQPGPFYQYPTSGVLPLLEDSTYYWRVVALIPTSSDPTHPLEMSSTIWAFKIARMTPGQTDFVAAQTNAFLQNILPGNQFGGLFGQGGPLEGFSPTGVVMRNGEPIRSEELRRMMRGFLTGRLRVVSVTVE